MNPDHPSSPRLPFLVVLVVGLGLTGCGVMFSSLMHLAACPLCIVQRMLYLSLALCGVLGLLLTKRRAACFVLLPLMVSVAATGVFVAGYQSWLQRFQRFASCAADYPWWEQLVDWAGERVPLLFRASGSCSEPGWKLLGLSIAEMSLIAFSALFLLSAFALWQTARRKARLN